VRGPGPAAALSPGRLSAIAGKAAKSRWAKKRTTQGD